MNRLYRKFVLPALTTVGLALAMPAIALAHGGHPPRHGGASNAAHHTWPHGSGADRRGGHRQGADWRHDGHERSGHRHWRSHGLARLPELPILVDKQHPLYEGPQRIDMPIERPRRIPGVPDPVPSVHVGPGGGLADGDRGVGNGYGFPDRLEGGTYAGTIEAARDPGNGLYFDLYGTPYDQWRRSRSGGPTVKVIEVKPNAGNAGCQMQQGVCIIRP